MFLCLQNILKTQIFEENIKLIWISVEESKLSDNASYKVLNLELYFLELINQEENSLKFFTIILRNKKFSWIIPCNSIRLDNGLNN